MDALPSGYAARSLTPADLDQVYAVYAADELANAGELSIEREDIDSDWSRPSFDLAADAIAVSHAGAIVAAGEIARHGNRAEAAVHPDHQGRGIGQWLESWLADRAVRQGASSIAQIAPQGSTKDRFLIDSGYALAHTSWVLQLPEGAAIPDRPLPLVMPYGRQPATTSRRHTRWSNGPLVNGRAAPGRVMRTGAPPSLTDQAPNPGNCA